MTREEKIVYTEKSIRLYKRHINVALDQAQNQITTLLEWISREEKVLKNLYEDKERKI